MEPTLNRKLSKANQSQGLLRLTILAVTGIPILVFGLFQMRRFDGLYGQDAYAYHAYATGPLLTALREGQPLPSFFWPPGYPLLIALAGLATGGSARAGQFISVVAGTLVPVFTALIAWEVLPSRKIKYPLMVGLLAGFTGQLWQSSVVVMADSTALVASTFGIWSLLRYGKSMQRGKDIGNFQGTASILWLIASTGSLAFAVLTRWGYALVAIPSLAYTLYSSFKMPWNKAVLHLITASLVGLLVLSPILSDTLAFVLGDRGGSSGFVGNLRIYTWTPANIFLRQFETTDGFLTYRFPNGIYYGLAPAHWFYFTPVLALLLIPGIFHVWRNKNAHWLLLLGWGGLVTLFHAGAPWQNFRFTLAYLPPLAVIAGLGFSEMNARISRKRQWITNVFLLLGFAWMSYGGWTLTNRFVDRKNDYLQIMNAVEEQLPQNARLVAFGLTLAYSHYYDREIFELFSQDEASLRGLMQDKRPIYLLADPEVIMDQWIGRTPERNLRWLEENTQLTPISEHTPYVLYAVNQKP